MRALVYACPRDRRPFTASVRSAIRLPRGRVVTLEASPFARAFADRLRPDLRARLDESSAAQAPGDALSIRAIETLAEVVSGSAPEGAEVFLAVSRPAVPVSRITACVVVARWQVRARAFATPGIVPIEADALGADRLVRSAAAARLGDLFRAAGFAHVMQPIPGQDEVRFEASRR